MIQWSLIAFGVAVALAGGFVVMRVIGTRGDTDDEPRRVHRRYRVGRLR
jgi:hypothetical protein